jgi:hypothetical protein
MALNSVRLIIRIKLVKSGGYDIENDEPNTVGCVNNLLNSVFISLGVFLNGKPITIHKPLLQGVPSKASKLRF